MSKIIGLKRLDDSIQQPSLNGDNWHMTWAENDYQYCGLCDGNGWEHIPENLQGKYNTRVFLIEGNAPNHSFKYLKGYPELENHWPPSKRYPKLYGRYYGFGILAIDGFIYQFLSTPKALMGSPGDYSFIGAKLIYSPDNGQTWMNQNGSYPVYWEKWEERNRENMIFFNEPGEAFSLLTVLQMGKNYENNKDDYIYIYAPNGNEGGRMNQLVMLRVKKNKILYRSEYEYFVSANPDGTANWSCNIQDRGEVCTFPNGWVNWKTGGSHGHPYAWHPSVVYIKSLDVYLMTNWGTGVGNDGVWFGKPSYLGFWTAPKPWGPWSQVHEETAWTPNSDMEARAYQPQISPKWIANDGKSFWLVWTDLRNVSGSMPYYAFNCQKVLVQTK